MLPIPLLDESEFARRYAWEPLPFPLPILPETPRILILKLSAIGDCLIASPLSRAIRERYPRAHIAWAVQSKARAVVEGNPYLDEILVWEGSKWSGALQLARQVRARRFDAVLDLQGTLKTLPVMAFSGAQVRAVSGRAKSISRRLANCVAPIREPQPHAGEQYFRVAQCLDLAPDASRELIMPVGEADRAWAQNFWRENGLEGRCVVALNPGSARAIKQWPAAQFARLAQMLEESGARTVLLGAPNELELARQIAIEAGGTPIVAAGQTTLKQLGALLGRCDLMVSADTGPMHIAAAMGTPLVALFGPTDPACTGPVSPLSRVVMRDLPCRPCFQQPTCQRFECLTELEATAVFPIAQEQIQRFGKHKRFSAQPGALAPDRAFAPDPKASIPALKPTV